MTIAFRPNGDAEYYAVKTWGADKGKVFPYSGRARIMPKRVRLGGYLFDRATGSSVDRHFTFANYQRRLIWYQLDGQERVDL